MCFCVNLWSQITGSRQKQVPARLWHFRLPLFILRYLNPLTPGWCGCYFECVICKFTLITHIFNISCKTMIFWFQWFTGCIMIKTECWSQDCQRAVLEIPTGQPVRGRQLWRRAGNFLLIFLQFYVYDLRFKAWGLTTFLTEFQTLPACAIFKEVKNSTLTPLTNIIEHGLTLIPAWVSNHIHYHVWDEITYPPPNFNSCTVEVWEWISNFIPHSPGCIITYPCWD